MESEYIIVRRSKAMAQLLRARRDGEQVRGTESIGVNVQREIEAVAAATAEGMAAQEVFTLARERLDERAAADALREDEVVTGALAMPVTLIAPLGSAEDSVADAKAARVSWGVKAIRADVSKYSGVGVKVAVLDTGLDFDHSAFKGRGIEFESEDFTGTGLPTDDHGHGTHCAGTIFGRDVDGVRIGVAPEVTKACIAKVLNDKGRGTSSAVADAIGWAIRKEVDVISMSLGFDFPGMAERLQEKLPPKLAASQALRAFRDNLRLFDTLMMYSRMRSQRWGGCVIIAAAGNESRTDENPDFRIDVSLPAASQDIVSVGALRKLGQKLGSASFSNVNPTLAAPGVDIVSAARGGELVGMSGTSMACPHVAGIAALWWQALRKENQGSAQNVAAKLIARADRDVFEPGLGPIDHGAGLALAP
ncbi:S8 family serine peptidase [Bradyrhizobium sp. S3.2.12]|uniref:S8 family peptidase n=1 Tax=Bradyrhizobium sp. S3.2.12 TaxID=3156387 RepID=UPI0033921711